MVAICTITSVSMVSFLVSHPESAQCAVTFAGRLTSGLYCFRKRNDVLCSGSNTWIGAYASPFRGVPRLETSQHPSRREWTCSCFRPWARLRFFQEEATCQRVSTSPYWPALDPEFVDIWPYVGRFKTTCLFCLAVNVSLLLIICFVFSYEISLLKDKTNFMAVCCF